MLSESAVSNPFYALLPGDSFAVTRTSAGRRLLDSVTTGAAVRRARAEALNTARSWVASQPTTLRAHGAMVNAHVTAGNYQAALSEVERFREATPLHPELPFVQARIRFASGQVERAAAQLRPRWTRWRRGIFSRTRGRPPFWATSPPPRMSSPTRAIWKTPPRRSTWPTRCGGRCCTSPSWSAGDPKGESWRRARAGRAVRRRRSAGGLIAADLAERGRGRPDGDARQAETPGAHRGVARPSGCLPALRPTAPR